MFAFPEIFKGGDEAHVKRKRAGDFLQIAKFVPTGLKPGVVCLTGSHIRYHHAAPPREPRLSFRFNLLIGEQA
jgi:hypothetical protein